MHHGIIAATSDAAGLIDAIDALQPRLIPGDSRGSLADLDLKESDAGWQLAYGELGDRAYVLDTSFLLSAQADTIVSVSGGLTSTVVGCGAETTSGTYWFAAAENGRLIRAYWNSYSVMWEPWSKGPALPSEEAHPFEQLDGDGLTAGLSALGFDYTAWAALPNLRILSFDLSDPPTGPMIEGPLARELREFTMSVAIPEGKAPKPTAIRRDGGWDLATKPPVKRGGAFGFLRRG